MDGVVCERFGSVPEPFMEPSIAIYLARLPQNSPAPRKESNKTQGSAISFAAVPKMLIQPATSTF